LRLAIAEDRAAGRRPFCIIGTAGTVNTGAFDDLSALADLAAEERLWFHVDGAFGALAALSPTLRPLVRGLERADSLAFDFHKWLHVPYSAGCLLVRDEGKHREAFTTHPSYLASQARGLAGGAPWFCDYGPELSRGALAFKVWFTIQEHGLRKLGSMIEKNCAQARELADLVRSHPRLELRAPVSLNIVCFRYVRDGLDEPALERINQEIIVDLQERGVAAPSSTRLGEVFVIRVNLTNHRTLRADLALLAESVAASGDRLTATTPAT
jgi:glutamate/tyrosine decarboxylase-like PLP-dependent enzyme